MPKAKRTYGLMCVQNNGESMVVFVCHPLGPLRFGEHLLEQKDVNVGEV